MRLITTYTTDKTPEEWRAAKARNRRRTLLEKAVWEAARGIHRPVLLK